MAKRGPIGIACEQQDILVADLDIKLIVSVPLGILHELRDEILFTEHLRAYLSEIVTFMVIRAHKDDSVITQ